MTKLRELLNCVMWNPSERKEKANYLITYRDGYKLKTIHMNEVIKVYAFGFLTFDGYYLPLHRIRMVKKDNEILWRKSPEK